VKQYGLKKVYIFGLIWGGTGFVIFSFLGQDFTSAIIMFIIVGAGFSAVLVTAQAIFADCIDYDETQTGKRRETTYSGVNALLSNKPAISIANALFLWVIQRFGYVEPTEGEIYIPPESVKWGIMVGVALLPGIFMLITGLIMKKYPLEGKEWKKTKRELEKLHLKKERKYLEYVKKIEEGKEVKEPDLSVFDARNIGYDIPKKKKPKLSTFEIWLIITNLILMGLFIALFIIQGDLIWLVISIVIPVFSYLFRNMRKKYQE